MIYHPSVSYLKRGHISQCRRLRTVLCWQVRYDISVIHEVVKMTKDITANYPSNDENIFLLKDK